MNGFSRMNSGCNHRKNLLTPGFLYVPNRDSMQITSCLLSRERTPWPTSLSWKRNYVRLWLVKKKKKDSFIIICHPETWASVCLQLHTFWVDAENYANLTRPWFASRSPFPLNFFVPGRQASVALSRILLTKAEAPLHSIAEVEGKVMLIQKTPYGQKFVDTRSSQPYVVLPRT